VKRSRALNTGDAPDFNRVWRGWGLIAEIKAKIGEKSEK